MNTITFGVTDEEMAFIQSIADLKEVNVSELARTILLDGLEDQVDIDLFEKAIKEHELNDKSISHQDMLSNLSL